MNTFLLRKSLAIVLFSLPVCSLIGQSLNYSGRVTDEHNEPLTGVSVRIQNAGRGTFTKQDGGLFTIKLLNTVAYQPRQ